ncbi:hypothetical protein DW657_00510 [Prevotella sp. AM23-5]|nr:hypothetical protein DW657_00510 [Prevotella sp. AM23-5]
MTPKILKGLIGENKKSPFFLLLTYFPALYCIFMRKNAFLTCTVEITQYALKGQKLLAQGIALGNYER